MHRTVITRCEGQSLSNYRRFRVDGLPLSSSPDNSGRQRRLARAFLLDLETVEALVSCEEAQDFARSQARTCSSEACELSSVPKDGASGAKNWT